MTLDGAIGVDLGDIYCDVCVLDAAGEIVEEARVRTTESALRHRFEGLDRTRIALEVGTHSPWISRLLESCGHEVIVANPSRLSRRQRRKNNRRDAELLARQARTDPKQLEPIRHRSQVAQIDLSLIRTRQLYVRQRTRMVSHVRGAAKAIGERIPKSLRPDAFDRRARQAVPESLRRGLNGVLNVIGQLNTQILVCDREIVRLCRESYPETERLRQVYGVGPVTALTYVLTLEDPSRFERSRDVGPYLGLVPDQQASGDRDPELSITKTGDRMLRTFLVQCAHCILGRRAPDSDLRRWGQALAAKGGKSAKKRAIVAVARKLAILLHRLWVSGETYEPHRQTDAA
jgi:transposase